MGKQSKYFFFIYVSTCQNVIAPLYIEKTKNPILLNMKKYSFQTKMKNQKSIIRNNIKISILLKKTHTSIFLGWKELILEFSFQLKIILHQEHPFMSGLFYHEFLTSLYGSPHHGSITQYFYVGYSIIDPKHNIWVASSWIPP